jgi:hypothetical protein
VVRKCADTSQRNKVFRQFQGHGCILLNDGQETPPGLLEGMELQPLHPTELGVRLSQHLVGRDQLNAPRIEVRYPTLDLFFPSSLYFSRIFRCRFVQAVKKPMRQPGTVTNR